MGIDIGGQWPVLVVEDDLPTAELEVKVLQRSGRRARIVQWVDDAVAALQRERYSVVLLDYLLADENGWRVLDAAQACTPPIPVIVVTGKGNEEVAVEALRRGVADYIIKNGDFWEHLPSIVERIEKTAEAGRLRAFLASVVESSDDAIIGTTPNGTITSWNHGASRIFGASADKAIGRPVAEFFQSDHVTQFTRALEVLSQGERVKNFETIGVRADGGSISLSIAMSPLKSDVPGVSVVARDISERKHAEEHLRRTEFELRRLQKFEAIREIAGGVAHEFNNLLTVIIVRSELMKGNLAADSSMREDLDLIIKTGERAALVSRQLLAFSRQQFLRPKLISLNTLILDMQKNLKSVAGPSIQLDMRLDPKLGKVKADPQKIEEVIMNLTLNAKDALQDAGKITFETAPVTIDAEFIRTHDGCKPGPYARLSVSDTGCGIDEATLPRIFDPFFTTKGRATRSGLGLAMVYGTVKQSEGYIYAISQPGAGARFEIYLPIVESAPRKNSGGDAASSGVIINKTILIVEDEANVLEIVREILGHCGYSLLTAGSPSEALNVAEDYTGTINLLLTDVVMPEMNGPELAIRLCSLHPEMKVLYMSGYPENHLGISGNSGIEFLPKPFSFEGLTRKVKEVIFRK